MFDVKTDHTIVGGDDTMKLVDRELNEIVVATRTPAAPGEPLNPWTVHANVGEVADVTDCVDRPTAINAMAHQAYLALGPNDKDDIPGDGYSTTVPHGLTETP